MDGYRRIGRGPRGRKSATCHPGVYSFDTQIQGADAYPRHISKEGTSCPACCSRTSIFCSCRHYRSTSKYRVGMCTHTAFPRRQLPGLYVTTSTISFSGGLRSVTRVLRLELFHHGSRPLMWCVLGSGGRVACYRDATHLLRLDRSVYPGEKDETTPLRYHQTCRGHAAGGGADQKD